jgi:hypothetical protein
MLQWLDTLIGLVVILLAVSLVVMILTQIIVALLNLRGYNLKNGIKILLKNTGTDISAYAEMITNAVLTHPLISDKRRNSGRWSLATTITQTELINILEMISKTGIEAWQVQLKNSLENINKNINQWFDSVMYRTSQAFIKHTRVWTVIFSIVIAFALHLDFLSLFEQISNNPELRASLVASSNAILNQAEEVLGSSSIIPAVYSKSISQLKLEDKTGTANGLGEPPSFISRKEGENWIREQLGGSEQTDSLIIQYGQIINKGLSNSVEKIKDQAFSIKNELDNTKLHLIPHPSPGLNYSFGDRHFFGVLIMAAFLSFGAPFWFKALKTVSALRPVLASKEDKAKKESVDK